MFSLTGQMVSRAFCYRVRNCRSFEGTLRARTLEIVHSATESEIVGVLMVLSGVWGLGLGMRVRGLGWGPGFGMGSGLEYGLRV